ncbi:MAG: VIT1/CCC1 transporter family protein [Candidatus Micrarchaeota archaeon]
MKLKEKPSKEPVPVEPHSSVSAGSTLRQIILGGQDGLVNVLGIILGLAAAVSVNSSIGPSAVLIGGLAATFAESISMAAVAYTSAKAQRDFYYSELAREKMEIKKFPEIEREEVKVIYMKKGFRRKQLAGIVDKICSNERMWLDVMMTEELSLTESKNIHPMNEAFVVGASAMVGSLIPLAPFFFMDVQSAIFPSLVISGIALFVAGAYKGKTTSGSLWKTGIEMVLIGLASAFIGYVVGSWAGNYFA